MSLEKRPSLIQFQRQFSQALTQDTYDAQELFGSLQAESLAEVELRLGVYRNAYRLRMEGALEEDFPILAERLGAEGFSNLVRGFLKESGSVYSSLAELGKSFVPYLKENRGLASFEWAVVLSSLAPDALSSADPVDLTENHIPVLTPSALEWSGKREGLDDREVRLLIWHRLGEAESRKFSDREWVLFELIRADKSILELGIYCSEKGWEASELQTLFARWASDGIIVTWKEGKA